MTKTIEGHYHCHGCGNYFKAEGGGAQTCPECNISQFSVSVWDDVIHRREKNVAFESSSETYKRDEAVERNRTLAEGKLDIVGKKRAQQKAVLILVGLVWLCGIGFYLYKGTKKGNVQMVGDSQVSDGTISDKDYQKMFETAQTCADRLNAFLTTKRDRDRLQHLFEPNEEVVSSYYSTKEKPHNIGLVKVTKFHIEEERAEVLFVTTTNHKVEAVFVKKDGKWLLDWEAFVNYSTMSFDDFLLTQPTETHTFRLYLKTQEDALDSIVSLHGYKRHEQILNGFTDDIATIPLSRNHPIMPKLQKVVEASRYYEKFNSFLNEKESGALGLDDPSNHYRVNISLAYKQQPSGKKLEIIDISGAHWMGSHYTDLLRREQKLLFEQHSKK